MPEATIRSAVDTYAASAYPSTNYGAARRLGTLTGSTYAYVYFTRPMPLKAIVTSAKLRLFYNTNHTVGTTVTAVRTSAPLQASRLTWNSRPLTTYGSPSPAATCPVGPAGTMVEIDVKDIMQAVADGAHWYGLRLGSGTLRWWGSAEGASAYRPQLYVKWSEAPHAPTSLTPDGNEAVSVAKPVLRFQVTDVLGDTTINAVNVQTDDAPDFAGAFDSGWFTTGDNQLDLAALTAPAFPGLTEGQSIYWRVRVRDGAGLVSAWSDDAQLRRVSHKALTIDNPAAGSPAFVEDPTPPILWTFAGTQVQWQVFVKPADDPRKVLVNSGIRTSTETAWTLPTGTLKGAGPYIVTVRVWDNVDRDAADAYVEATREFVVKPSTTVVPVTGLAVTQPEPWPGTLLTWSRATAPDFWVIERDGVVIEDALPAEEAFVSGTAYEFEDDWAKAWQAHTWRVRAKVNGAMSESASLTRTPTLRGIWLMNRRRKIRVFLAGQDGGTWTEPEDATTVAPLGASRTVRRVQGVRNYEGSITGQLVDAFGRTMAQYEADLRRLRAEPMDAVSLVAADFALRVLLGNVQFAPTSNHVPPSRLVSFDFWAV